MIRTLIISSTKERSICWKKNTFETTWTKTSKNTSTFIRFVIESSSWNTNRTTCYNRFLSSKDRNKIERWISSSICHSRSTEKSCTIRCWWWSIVISNSICTFHQKKREMSKIWRTHWSMKSLLNSKDSSSSSQIEILFLFSSFDHRFVIICEYVYDITSFIIRKSTSKSKDKIKLSNRIWKIMSIINKMIESNDST
jgi:hypothetical protein